jgi:hypothetical protein
MRVDLNSSQGKGPEIDKGPREPDAYTIKGMRQMTAGGSNCESL